MPYTDPVSSLSGTLRAYRADVNTYFPVGTNGVRFASGNFSVSLPNGGTVLPLTEGASLVVIYRVLVAPNSTTPPSLPLKAVVIYDGSAVPTGTVTQNVAGFYDALAGANHRQQICQRFPGAGAGLDDQVALLFEGFFYCLRHLQLAAAKLVRGMRLCQQASRCEELVERESGGARRGIGYGMG